MERPTLMDVYRQTIKPTKKYRSKWLTILKVCLPYMEPEDARRIIRDAYVKTANEMNCYREKFVNRDACMDKLYEHLPEDFINVSWQNMKDIIIGCCKSPASHGGKGYWIAKSDRAKPAEIHRKKETTEESVKFPGLFEKGDFKLASEKSSDWIINCRALDTGSWDALAAMAVKILPPFGKVEGVPFGGLSFAIALSIYTQPGCETLLIAEDVVTTGGSMEKVRGDREAIGVCVFCRGECPGWVTPLFTVNEKLKVK